MFRTVCKTAVKLYESWLHGAFTARLELRQARDHKKWHFSEQSLELILTEIKHKLSWKFPKIDLKNLCDHVHFVCKFEVLKVQLWWLKADFWLTPEVPLFVIARLAVIFGKDMKLGPAPLNRGIFYTLE